MCLVAYFYPFYNFSHFLQREPHCWLRLRSRFEGEAGRIPTILGQWPCGESLVRETVGAPATGWHYNEAKPPLAFA